MNGDQTVLDAPRPVLSMILPGCDRRALKALAADGDILWELKDIGDAPDQECLENFMQDIVLALDAGKACNYGGTAFHVRPTEAELDVIVGWLDLFRPLLTAHLSFQSMRELDGAAYTRSVAVFSTPALKLFRSAVDTHAGLTRLRGWLDRYRWDAVLRGAHAQDLALWAVLSNIAGFEGRGSDQCIRLHSPLSP